MGGEHYMQDVGTARNADIPLSEGNGRGGVRISLGEAIAVARLRHSTPKVGLRGNRDVSVPVSPPHQTRSVSQVPLKRSRASLDFDRCTRCERLIALKEGRMMRHKTRPGINIPVSPWCPGVA
jgi:hypothetical protein